MKYILAFIFTALSIRLHAQNNSYLLEGSIGTYPVVMNLSYDDSTCGAVYFYKAAKKDIQLTGVTINAELILYAASWNSKIKSNDTFETIILRKGDNGTFSGSCDNKKSRLPVSLHVVDLKAMQNPFATIPYVRAQKIEDPYNYMRILAMQVIKDSVVKKSKYTLEYAHVENSKVGLFRVTDGAGKLVMDKINSILDNAFIESAARYFSCASYEYAIRSLFINQDVISINTFEEYDCGGAHPDYENLPININTRTGEKLALEDILFLSADKIPDPESDQWLTYRHDVFGPKLTALLKTLYPKHMREKEPCNYAQGYIWDYAKWYLTDNGLYLSPEFPHVAAICRDPDWSFIPFETLKKYKNTAINITLP